VGFYSRIVFSAGRLPPSDEVRGRLVRDPAQFDRLNKKGDDMADDSKRQAANGNLAKPQRAQTEQRAPANYEIEAAALRAKTERLKALRLARDGAAAPKSVPAGSKQKSKKRSGGGGGSLADFLDGQAKEGRNG
jgi:hypothetical protein